MQMENPSYSLQINGVLTNKLKKINEVNAK